MSIVLFLVGFIFVIASYLRKEFLYKAIVILLYFGFVAYCWSGFGPGDGLIGVVAVVAHLAGFMGVFKN